MLNAAGEIIVEHLEQANGFASRFLGLMFRVSLAPNAGLLLDRCSSIHTFFMRFAIDVVYLTRDYQVIRIAAAVKPWRLSMESKAHSVLELPSGRSAELALAPGQQLKLDTSG